MLPLELVKMGYVLSYFFNFKVLFILFILLGNTEMGGLFLDEFVGLRLHVFNNCMVVESETLTNFRFIDRGAFHSINLLGDLIIINLGK